MNSGGSQVIPGITRTLRCAVLCGLWFACFVLAYPVAAQMYESADQWELEPRPGEQRMNRFQYFTTHNSFERVDDIRIQLDYYDVWMIELDLRWSDDINDFYIMHDCADAAGRGPLDDFLAEIDGTQRATSGLTFILFDEGDIGPCIFYPSLGEKPGDWGDRLKNKFVSLWGDRVYTGNEFKDTDDHRWPSAQELLRRGKNIIPILSGGTRGAGYFLVQDSDPDHVPPEFPFRCITINTGSEDDVVSIASLGDRQMARHYPNSGWVCWAGDGYDGWQWAVANNYTFPASNCSDMAFDTPRVYRLHPPLPMYINIAGSTAGRGTWSDPLGSSLGLVFALDKVKKHEDRKGASMAEISIQTGTYLAPQRITSAVRLTSRLGTVRLVSTQ